MFIYRFASLAFAIVTLFGQPVTARPRCSHPSVRREWRSLTPHERAEWITAVKVNTSGRVSCIADTSLPSVFTRYPTTLLWCPPSTQPTPQFHPSTPAVHISTVRLYRVFSRALLHTDADWVYVHMDLNPVVSPCWTHPLPRQQSNTNLDPPHRPVLTLASCICQRFRNYSSEEMRIHGHSTVLGLDARYALAMSTPRR